MKIMLWAAAMCAASGASAQITSVSDPSAYKPDKPRVVAPAVTATPPAPAANPAPTPMQVTPVVAQVAAPPAMAQTTAPDTSGARPLNLTCFGGGTANKMTSAMAWSRWGTVNAIGQRQQGFEDQVDIRLFGGDDRIRLPRTILPPIHGGDGGWFKLKNVVADARSIKANAGINFINSPKVHIDRVTGSISISGKAGDYTGQCQAMDPNAAPKF